MADDNNISVGTITKERFQRFTYSEVACFLFSLHLVKGDIFLK